MLLHCLRLTPLEGYIIDPDDYVSKLMVSNVVQLPYLSRIQLNQLSSAR